MEFIVEMAKKLEYTCEVYSSMPQEKKKEILKALESENGLTAVSKNIVAVFGEGRKIADIVRRAKKEDVLSVIRHEADYIKRKNIESFGDDRLSPKDLDRIRRYVDILNVLFRSSPRSVFVSYEETALYEQAELFCPICGERLRFLPGHDGERNKYGCPSGSCDIVVACHPNSALPSGLPATKPTRLLRKELHDLTKEVFRGPRSSLYGFLEKAIGRKFNVYDGHIGSMSLEECSWMIDLVNSLSARAEQVRGSEGFLMESYFVTHANKQELKAFKFLLESSFDLNGLRKSGILGNCFRPKLLRMISKGLPMQGEEMRKLASKEELDNLELAMLQERGNLTRRIRHGEVEEEFIFF